MCNLGQACCCHSQGLTHCFMLFNSNQAMVLSSAFVDNRFIFPYRIPNLPSEMVTGEMRVADNAEVSEGPCNQLVPSSAQPWDSFENLRCIHATFQHLNASGTAQPGLHSVIMALWLLYTIFSSPFLDLTFLKNISIP